MWYILIVFSRFPYNCKNCVIICITNHNRFLKNKAENKLQISYFILFQLGISINLWRYGYHSLQVSTWNPETIIVINIHREIKYFIKPRWVCIHQPINASSKDAGSYTTVEHLTSYFTHIILLIIFRLGSKQICNIFFKVYWSYLIIVGKSVFTYIDNSQNTNTKKLRSDDSI